MAVYASTPSTHRYCSSAHAGIRRVCVIFLLASGMWLQLPAVTWASVYQCVDQAGRRVLTNRTAGFKTCHIILDNATGEPKSGTGKKPKPVNQPTDEGMMPSFSDTLYPSTTFPNDSPMPPMNAPPNDASSSQPCNPGFNPLNPMSTAPCAQADEPTPSGSAPSRQ